MTADVYATQVAPLVRTIPDIVEKEALAPKAGTAICLDARWTSIGSTSRLQIGLPR